jgi:replicative DNA helicase
MTELPASLENEQATLGAILVNRDALTPIAPWLPAAAFYLEKHAWIYAAMLACYQARTPPDIRTVSDMLRQRGQFDTIGGAAYLLTLADAVPTSYHVEYYARIVERCAIQRAGIAAAGRMAGIAYDGTDSEQIIADMQAELTRLSALRASHTTFVPFSAIVDEVYDELASETAPGTPTGFRDLDELTGGLHGGDLLILAARPGVGKTSLAGCLACNVAGLGLPVAFVSLEMGRKGILARAAAMYAGVDLAGVRDRRLSDDERAAYVRALGWAHDQPIYVEDTPGLTMASIRSAVLRLRVELGALSLVVVDYLQLMRSSGKKERWLEVGDMSRELKQLARELDVPVLALSQLSRAVEGRTSHVPMLSDLRESGNLEQDADIVLFIYRPELYEKTPENAGAAELHIAKHRNGSTGIVPLTFDASTTRFASRSFRSPEGY